MSKLSDEETEFAIVTTAELRLPSGLDSLGFEGFLEGEVVERPIAR